MADGKRTIITAVLFVEICGRGIHYLSLANIELGNWEPLKLQVGNHIKS